MIDKNKLKSTIRQIAKDAQALKDEFVNEQEAQISECCVFCKDNREYRELIEAICPTGRIAKETPSGPVYIVPDIVTSAGLVHIVKIRLPDPTRLERGYADFTAKDYQALKEHCSNKAECKVIQREEFEMIELMADGHDVRIYFSNPPVTQHTGIREALAKYSS